MVQNRNFFGSKPSLLMVQNQTFLMVQNQTFLIVQNQTFLIVQNHLFMKQTLTFILMIFTAFAFAQSPDLQMVQYENGFDRPVDIVHAGDDRLFIVEQGGKIKIIDATGETLTTPFLQLSVNFGANEQGLLGMTFHPNYADNGYFYVNYTSGNGDGFSKISRFTVDAANPNLADASSELELLTVTQPAWNHNAGDIAFGPDGYLYIGFGDGGSGGDPWGNGQNTETFLGKMLRIDVDNGTPYSIPADNPFVGNSDVLDEIWAIGMRNPWRISFDKITGDLWIGDVGQGDLEEIDFEPAGSAGGLNYGWRCYEGEDTYNTSNCAPISDFTFPVASYKVNNFCNSVTGGFVYRNCEYPDLTGRYLYADYCHGMIWSVHPDGAGGWIEEELFDNGQYDISTFGEDMAGNLYLARLSAGVIYKVTTNFSADNLITYDAGADVMTAPADYEGYQWYNGGSPLAGETNNTLAAVEATYGGGTYTCEITYNVGTCTVVSGAIEIEGVGTYTIEGLSGFSFSPNPFEKELILQLKSERAFDMGIEVLDLTGKVLHTTTTQFEGEASLTMDLSGLSSGVYFVKLTAGSETMSRRVVKR